MSWRRYGMTLIELLVVLAILALLTTVAITSTDVLLSQGRYDATVRTLNEVQEAILGPINARQPDGTRVTGGFVADIGRLPVPAGSDRLGELWALPNGMSLFAVRPASDPEVLVPCGWRGPYLRLPVGSGEVRDGWGNYFDPAVDSSGMITGLRSRGADSLAGVPESGAGAYDPDLMLTFAAGQLNIAVGGNVYLRDASGTRTNPDAAQVTVVLYGPNPTTGLVLETAITTTATAAGLVQLQEGGAVRYEFAPISAGPRFVRAYFGSLPITSATLRSPVVNVQQGGVFHLDILQMAANP